MTPWTAAYQAPPSVRFSRQEYWSGVPLPSPRLSLELNHKQLEGQPEKFLNLSYSMYADLPNAYDQHIYVTKLGMQVDRGLLAEELEIMMH